VTFRAGFSAAVLTRIPEEQPRWQWARTGRDEIRAKWPRQPDLDTLPGRHEGTRPSQQVLEVGLEVSDDAGHRRQSGLLAVMELQQPHPAKRPMLYLD